MSESKTTTGWESMTAAELERAAAFPAWTWTEKEGVKAAKREIRRRCATAGGDPDRLAEMVKAGEVTALSAIADLLR